MRSTWFAAMMLCVACGDDDAGPPDAGDAAVEAGVDGSIDAGPPAGPMDTRPIGEDAGRESELPEPGPGCELNTGDDRDECPLICIELCNSKDDDCDGEVDEELVRECGNDVGDCTAGTQTCDDGLWDVCPGMTGSVEICDGRDNDCNGAVDDEAFCSATYYPFADEAACVEGTCRISKCDPGRADCDGDPSNGCEFNTLGGTLKC